MYSVLLLLRCNIVRCVILFHITFIDVNMLNYYVHLQKITKVKRNGDAIEMVKTVKKNRKKNTTKLRRKITSKAMERAIKKTTKKVKK